MKEAGSCDSCDSDICKSHESQDKALFIGTVHTFQGKQASAVFFVLDEDRMTLGSVEWASRKPNLLNVAVT